MLTMLNMLNEDLKSKLSGQLLLRIVSGSSSSGDAWVLSELEACET